MQKNAKFKVIIIALIVLALLAVVTIVVISKSKDEKTENETKPVYTELVFDEKLNTIYTKVEMKNEVTLEIASQPIYIGLDLGTNQLYYYTESKDYKNYITIGGVKEFYLLHGFKKSAFNYGLVLLTNEGDIYVNDKISTSINNINEFKKISTKKYDQLELHNTLEDYTDYCWELIAYSDKKAYTIYTYNIQNVVESKEKEYTNSNFDYVYRGTGEFTYNVEKDGTISKYDKNNKKKVEAVKVKNIINYPNYENMLFIDEEGYLYTCENEKDELNAITSSKLVKVNEAKVKKVLYKKNKEDYEIKVTFEKGKDYITNVKYLANK